MTGVIYDISFINVGKYYLEPFILHIETTGEQVCVQDHRMLISPPPILVRFPFSGGLCGHLSLWKLTVSVSPSDVMAAGQ